MLLTNCEFFVYESEIWYRIGEDEMKKLEESNYPVIEEMVDLISTFYPKAYAALCEEYKGCALNRPYYRFRIASRFIRCNFGQLDSIPDISATGKCNFECIPCPLRGECKYDRVICRPEFDHKLSAAEFPVLRMWYEGHSLEEIAEHLCLSPHTVNNHIRNAYRRLDIHTRSEFVKFASQASLF